MQLETKLSALCGQEPFFSINERETLNFDGGLECFITMSMALTLHSY